MDDVTSSLLGDYEDGYETNAEGADDEISV
jgi:hypothetical protein